ncbi:hypothetical protein LYNGBM3L_42110 [Moorena producens 3L]|uniref:Uncharacterized protein n=1 Tax=Moorena producens 3L TaxID=489825 RepID=F4XW06_9CYAN|nr:hypothetical protein LYNGBM3L_42110 [Moorena producens 3L]
MLILGDKGVKKLGIDPTQLPTVRGKVTPMEITAN